MRWLRKRRAQPEPEPEQETLPVEAAPPPRLLEFEVRAGHFPGQFFLVLYTETGSTVHTPATWASVAEAKSVGRGVLDGSIPIDLKEAGL